MITKSKSYRMPRRSVRRLRPFSLRGGDTAGFLHQKVFLVDRQCAAVGTVNLDNRSFRLNFELTSMNYSAAFVQAVETRLEKDFDHSRLVELVEHTERPFAFMLMSRSARWLAPIL